MVVLTKKIIDSHDLVVDTNILHCDDKSQVVNVEFDGFWKKHSSELELYLKIPYVVFGELLFQQTRTALKTLTRANESIARLEAVTNKSYSHRITEKRVKKEVKNRLDAWLKTMKADVLPVPITDINWARVVDDSIWRLPPFSFDEKKQDIEKGFRDAVILESLCDHVENAADNPVIFVCNDKLLRDAAEIRLKGKRIKILTSLDDVDSYLKLLREDFTESFVDSIIDKASLKFLKKNDEGCIVYKNNLSNVLVDLARDVISNPGSATGVSDSEFDPDEEWKPINAGNFKRLGNSQFVSLENGHTFYWREDVKYIRDYEVVSWDGDVTLVTLTLKFDVRWKSNVSEKGRFTNVEYLDSELIDTSVSHQVDE